MIIREHMYTSRDVVIECGDNVGFIIGYEGIFYTDKLQIIRVDEL